MKLSEIIDLQLEDVFLYLGEFAVVIWRENGYAIGDRNAAIHFLYSDDEKPVTIRTCHPSPQYIEFKDYQRVPPATPPFTQKL